MAIAAHACRLYLTGTSTTLTDQAADEVGSTGSEFQVTNVDKQILDPSVTVVGKDGGTPASLDTVDHLFGTVDFSSSPGGSVTVSGSYLPRYEVGTVTDFTVSMSSDILDTSTIDGSTFRDKMSALVDLSGSLTLLETPNQDYDTTPPASTDPLPGEIKLADLLMDGTPKVLEIDFPDTTQALRAWIIIESYENTGAVDGLVETSISFQGAPQTSAQTVVLGGAAYKLGDTDDEI